MNPDQQTIYFKNEKVFDRYVDYRKSIRHYRKLCDFYARLVRVLNVLPTLAMIHPLLYKICPRCVLGLNLIIMTKLSNKSHAELKNECNEYHNLSNWAERNGGIEREV